MVARKYTYVDFRLTAGTPFYATATNAIATASDNQVDYTLIKGQLFDMIQTGANAAVVPAIPTVAPFGWAWPTDASTDSIEVGEGAMLTGNVPYKSFTVGTDPAFFIRCRMSILTNVNRSLIAAIGFRKNVAQADVTSLVTLGSAYADSAFIGTMPTTGTTAPETMRTSTSLATSVTQTTLAHAAWTVAGTAVTGIDFKVLVSATGAVTYTIDGVADASAVAFPFANGTVLVPSLQLVNGNNATASPVVIQEYECGWQ